ncbi:MAG: L-rhamnose mutarotase [Chloroflexota bacterium]
MKSYGLTLCLKSDPALIARYKEYHRAVWPEVVAGLRQVGVTGMKIYLTGVRLFMYMETEDGFDPAIDFARASATPRGREWDELMASLQERAPEARSDEWWSTMEQVFDLNERRNPNALQG